MQATGTYQQRNTQLWLQYERGPIAQVHVPSSRLSRAADSGSIGGNQVRRARIPVNYLPIKWTEG